MGNRSLRGERRQTRRHRVDGFQNLHDQGTGTGLSKEPGPPRHGVRHATNRHPGVVAVREPGAGGD
jgi:hypothetical protein